MEDKYGMVCHIIRHNIALDKPFSYFLGKLKELPYSRISITDLDRNVGEGEIAHAIDINGELREGARFFEPYINTILKKYPSIENISDIKKVMSEVRLYIAHNTALLCGVEQALFGLLATKTKRNLTSLLGGKKSDAIFIQTTIPFMDSLEDYIEHLKNVVGNYNPKHAKFKIGKNLQVEFQAIEYLKSISDCSVSVDANQMFSNAFEAIDFANKLHKAKVSWAEQLLHKDNIKGLRELRFGTELKLMVDEGLHTALEAEYYAQNNLTDYFNIKLAKTGGILSALEIIEIADHYKIPYMLGSMLHGKLGIQYNLGFALSQNFVTNDFFSYFSVTETKKLGYISSNLTVTEETLYP